MISPVIKHKSKDSFVSRYPITKSVQDSKNIKSILHFFRCRLFKYSFWGNFGLFLFAIFSSSDVNHLNIFCRLFFANFSSSDEQLFKYAILGSFCLPLRKNEYLVSHYRTKTWSKINLGKKLLLLPEIKRINTKNQYLDQSPLTWVLSKPFISFKWPVKLKVFNRLPVTFGPKYWKVWEFQFSSF